MRCKECGRSDREKGHEGIVLECEACGYFPFDCRCYSKLGFTPARYVHCVSCERYNIDRVDTSRSGWRSGEY